MRKALIYFTVLAGAVMAIPAAEARPASDAPYLQNVQYYQHGGWRHHEWRRHEARARWYRHHEWRRYHAYRGW